MPAPNSSTGQGVAHLGVVWSGAGSGDPVAGPTAGLRPQTLCAAGAGRRGRRGHALTSSSYRDQFGSRGHEALARPGVCE